MIKTRFFILLLVPCLLLASCGTSHYKITLRDGREFMTASQPELNRKTGYYKFRSLSDKDALIRADEVLMINEM
ncbi:YgdI/YgdR family lipoprotein [Phragmitibacter flavus]|uniref:YgdI/YgdR family lipoprotein n=1 Tax=Phragmitibacter flavus TaxID=2576071 RepID=A0A5R8KDY6_9BACT|nr:YgdI/YgdR family lipoprotein [Phragmitibacter flavus]TLD70500.1 YgdI/YgdR family lipoprotein [Phragmitibacter flavus]